MYKRPKKKQLTQDAIPSTSLADMMFLLLIFFIMTATLTRVTGFVTDMPASGKADQSQSQQKTTTIALHEDKITVNDESVTMDSLRKYLKGLRLDQKMGEAKVIILQTAGHVTYQNYYETMALIQNSGGVVAIESEEGN